MSTIYVLDYEALSIHRIWQRGTFLVPTVDVTEIMIE
jgi:hypothetical protein